MNYYVCILLYNFITVPSTFHVFIKTFDEIFTDPYLRTIYHIFIYSSKRIKFVDGNI